jgi:hypothetical protein
MWSNDLLGQYHRLMAESPVGQLMKAGLTVAEALEKLKTDSGFKGKLLTVFYAFPYMSYYYGSMFVVIEGWKRLKGQSPNYYRDQEIDALLQSRCVAQLERHRHGAFHFTPEYFDERLTQFTFEENSDLWLHKLHTAFGRWFVFHLQLKPHERPRGI